MGERPTVVTPIENPLARENHNRADDVVSKLGRAIKRTIPWL